MHPVEKRLQTSLKEVKKLLDATRNPQIAADVPHSYGDKYLLAEFLTGVACAGEILCLETLGLTRDGLSQLVEAAGSRTVTLALRSEETCAFVGKEKRDVDGNKKHVTSITGALGCTVTDKVVTTVIDYMWDVTVSFELFAFIGTARDGDTRVVLRRGDRKTRVTTAAETHPYPKRSVAIDAEADVTWLLRQVEPGSLQVNFRVDRQHAECHTPRRNKDVEASRDCLGNLRSWVDKVGDYFTHHVWAMEKGHGLDTASVKGGDVFVPVLPLLEVRTQEGTQGAVAKICDLVSLTVPAVPAGAAVLLADDLQVLLAGQRTSLLHHTEQAATVIGAGKGIITADDARLVTTVGHMREVVAALFQAVDFVEHMLWQQVVAAIGKEVTSADFTEYMRFHMRKVLREDYTPRPFSHTVRRGQHSPEGVVALEQRVSGDTPEPITTVSRALTPAETRTMRFALDASSNVRFGGTRHVHSYIAHRFSTEAQPNLSLVARARQFSGFIMLVGAVGGADLFLPKHAMIVQNKDELKLPLLLDEIPTPKEFRDAIESLSPEQQRFAKAYRGMQLEATLFGVCVIQIKPQLEKVLNLPADSLTKEIQLAQDLLELFIEYQIPSDLLSFRSDTFEDEDLISPAVKVDQVRGHVASMRTMLDNVKKAELLEAKREKEMERLSRPPPPPAGGPPPPPCPAPMPLGGCQPSACGPPSGPPPGFFGGGGGGMMCAAPPPRPPSSCAAPPPPAPPGAAAIAPAPVPAPAPAPDASPAAVPEGATQQPQKPEEGVADAGEEGYDISRLPQILEKQYEALDTESCLRPTVIKTEGAWDKRFQRTLLSKEEETRLDKEAQRRERGRAFDLLDSLTRSGALEVDHAALHVVVAATHCFDKTLMDTIVQDNANPIEKVERSALIAASAVHSLAAASLLRGAQADRVQEHSPQLFLE